MSIENIKDFLEDVLALKQEAWKDFDKHIENKSLDKQQIHCIKQACKAESKHHSKQTGQKILQAVLLLHGTGFKKDPQKAAALLHSEAREKQAIAQFYLGNCYSQGQGVGINPQKAFHYFSMAAKENFIPALYQLATCYYFGQGVDVNRAEIKGIYERIAQIGDTETIYELAGRYESGYLIDPDHVEASRLYLLAATKGHADAQFHYGLCLARGRGVDKNLSDAIYYLELAANQDHAQALYLLGKYYSEGRGVKQNHKVALNLYSMASAKGSETASYRLGICYEQGVAVIPDLNMAGTFYFQSYLRSARAASFEALVRLGQNNKQPEMNSLSYLFLIYYLGIHVLPNKVKAIELFEQNPKEVMRCLYLILPGLLEEYDVYQEALKDLAEFLIHKTQLYSFSDVMSAETQEKIFSGLIQQHKNHINSGYSDSEDHTEKLQKMASLGIIGAQKALDECFSHRASLLKTLLDENKGNIEHHLTLLDKFSGQGNQKALKVSQQYHKQYAAYLLKQALDNNIDALMRLNQLALSRPECDTALGVYNLKMAQKATEKSHSKLSFFRSGSKSEVYYQNAYRCFVRAATTEYGPALYQLAELIGKGVYVDQNMSKALFYAFRAGQAGYTDKAIKFIKKFTQNNDEKLAITALIYQVLLSKKDFKDDRNLKKAYHKNGNVFAQRIEKIVSNVKMPIEKSLDLLNVVSRMKLKPAMKNNLEKLQKDLIYQQIYSMRGQLDTLEIAWIKNANPKLFIACSLVIASDHAKHSFHIRALSLFAAKRVAEMHRLSSRPINKMLSEGYYFKDAEMEVKAITEKIDQDLPLNQDAGNEKSGKEEIQMPSTELPVLPLGQEKPFLVRPSFHAKILPAPAQIAASQIRPASPRPKPRAVNSRHKQVGINC